MRPVAKNDLKFISDWAVARGFDALDPSLSPKTGYIVDGVAAGFLYQTDSKLGFIHNYITNPEASSKDRDKALNAITEAIFSAARSLNINILVFWSADTGIRNRALAFGATIIEESVTTMAINLKEQA